MSARGFKKEFSSISRNVLMLVIGASLTSPSLLLADQAKVQADRIRADVENVPVQGRLNVAQSKIVDEKVVENNTSGNDVPVVQASEAQPVSQDQDPGLSNKTLLGIGGAAVLLGVVAASSGGGGSSSSIDSTSGDKSAGSSDSSAKPATTTPPPKASQMVGVWHANAHSVEGKHYVGTYTLFSNGRHQYSIIGETGIHKSGVGRWDLRGYRLSLHNDSGTTYSGEFKKGNYRSLTLGTNVGWVLSLHK